MLSLLIAWSATAQKLNGSWLGKLSLNGGQITLRLVLHFTQDEEGNDLCTFDSPDQGADNIPATVNYVTADSVVVNLPTLFASYSGKIAEGQITGHLCQGKQLLPVTFKPGTATFNRPQTPLPTFSYVTENVSFVNKTDSVTLSGTLTYPSDYDSKKVKATPVVLMVTGSGTQNRDEALFGHKPFLVIADYLARHGIATLRYDDRGAGQSTGDSRAITIESNLRDAMAGLNYLERTKSFGKIGILGHSEGGVIAFMAAGRNEKMPDFIVSMAGCGVTGYKVLTYQNHNALLKSGMPDSITHDFCRALEQMFEYKIHHPSVHDAPEVADSLCAQSGVSLPFMLKAALRRVLAPGSPWMESFIAYDPTNDIATTKCPVMALNGNLDRQVPPAMGTKAIEKLLPDNKLTLIKEYPELNHLFQRCKTGQPEEYSVIEETISEEVLSDIVRWINGLK